MRLFFYVILRRIKLCTRYLPTFTPKSTISDETLEKKMLMRHYRNILNRHR